MRRGWMMSAEMGRPILWALYCTAESITADALVRNRNHGTGKPSMHNGHLFVYFLVSAMPFLTGLTPYVTHSTNPSFSFQQRETF